MKVGDLVVQLDWSVPFLGGWKADGVGIVTRVVTTAQRDPSPARVTVQWPNGMTDMCRNQLKVISESR